MAEPCICDLTAFVFEHSFGFISKLNILAHKHLMNAVKQKLAETPNEPYFDIVYFYQCISVFKVAQEALLQSLHTFSHFFQETIINMSSLFNM